MNTELHVIRVHAEEAQVCDHHSVKWFQYYWFLLGSPLYFCLDILKRVVYSRTLQYEDFYEVRLHLWTAATNGHIVRSPGHMWVWRMLVEWYWRENRRTQRETCPSATLSTTSLTWIVQGANLGLRGERPVTNHLSHGTAPVWALK
jgi:hypothetical protein